MLSVIIESMQCYYFSDSTISAVVPSVAVLLLVIIAIVVAAVIGCVVRNKTHKGMNYTSYIIFSDI